MKLTLSEAAMGAGAVLEALGELGQCGRADMGERLFDRFADGECGRVFFCGEGRAARRA